MSGRRRTPNLHLSQPDRQRQLLDSRLREACQPKGHRQRALHEPVRSSLWELSYTCTIASRGYIRSTSPRSTPALSTVMTGRPAANGMITLPQNAYCGLSFARPESNPSANLHPVCRTPPVASGRRRCHPGGLARTFRRSIYPPPRASRRSEASQMPVLHSRRPIRLVSGRTPLHSQGSGAAHGPYRKAMAVVAAR